MLNKTRKNIPQLFLKYFFSYFLIFLIPFTLISFSFYFVATKNLRDTIISSNTATLEQVRDFTDDRLSELRKLAVRISLDHRLTPYKLSQPYTGKEGIGELITYEVSNSVIDTLVLTFFDDPILYTSRGTTTVNNLITNMFHIAEDEHPFFKEELVTITDPILRTVNLRGPEDQQKKTLVYICPIPPQSPYYNGAVIFFIKESKLGQLIANVLGDFEGTAYIYDHSNTVITSSDGSVRLFHDLIENWSPRNSPVGTAVVQGEDYSLVTVHSSENELSFVTAMPTAQFYKEMDSLRKTILLMLGVTAIIGLVVTVRLSWRHYRPIQSLIQSVRNYLDGFGGTDTRRSVDLDGIRETIEVIFEDSKELRKKVIAQRSYVRDQYLLRLLRGNFSANEAPADVASELQITLKGNYYFVLIVSFNERISEKSLGAREKTLDMLQQVDYKDCIAYGIELFSENAMALIVIMANNSDAMRKEFSQRLVDSLINYLEITPTVGVGKICSSENWINHSFIEASAAVEHHMMGNGNHLIFFEDVTSARDVPDWYSYEKQVQLTHAIKQGDKNVSLEALHNITLDLREKKTSIHWLRYMCFDVINTVLKVNSELGMLVDLNAIEDLSEFSTIEGLEQKLGQLIVEMCAKVEKKKEDHNEQLNHRIIEFIEQEYTKHNLSLTKIADTFGLSASYLSKLIKEQTGSTFTQYVWDLRIATFKEKLISTDEPIKKLVCEIGYVDVANFTRKFRENEGITPGQFRSQYRNEA